MIFKQNTNNLSETTFSLSRCFSFSLRSRVVSLHAHVQCRNSIRARIAQVPVCGVPGIARAIINKTSSGAYELLCEGAAFGRVMGVPGVRAEKVRSSDCRRRRVHVHVYMCVSTRVGNCMSDCVFPYRLVAIHRRQRAITSSRCVVRSASKRRACQFNPKCV